MVSIINFKSKKLINLVSCYEDKLNVLRVTDFPRFIIAATIIATATLSLEENHVNVKGFVGFEVVGSD